MCFPQYFVIPAKAGIQEISGSLDSRFRGNDVWDVFSDKLLGYHVFERYFTAEL